MSNSTVLHHVFVSYGLPYQGSTAHLINTYLQEYPLVYMIGRARVETSDGVPNVGGHDTTLAFFPLRCPTNQGVGRTTAVSLRLASHPRQTAVELLVGSTVRVPLQRGPICTRTYEPA